MSWQAYADWLVSSGCGNAALIGKDGSPWAQAGEPASALQQSELAGIANKAANLSNGQGFHVGGNKFMALQVNGNCVYGAKGQEFFCSLASNTQVCILAWGPKAAHNAITDAVEKQSAQLAGAGF